MNDALRIAMAFGIALLAFWVLVGLFLIWLWHKAKVRIKRIELWANSEPTYKDLELLKPRENLSKDETQQIRDFLRARKEREARDQDTIDIATEFHREG